jgi:hypothetical protein
MAYDVFVHMDASGVSVGNGGFVMLSQLAQELGKMGYNVGVFDQRNRLEPEMTRWLSIEKEEFSIVDVESMTSGTAPVISGWLAPIVSEIISYIGVDRLRYWCNDEILRESQYNSRAIVLQLMDKIAINNKYLESIYRNDLGYRGEIVFLDNWVRSDHFHRDETVERREGSIGYQHDWNHEVVLPYLGDSENIVWCTGYQKTVAEKMRQSDFFVFWNRHKDCYSVPLEGETFGLSLFEAMACGCLCLSRGHGGNRFLDGTVHLADDPKEIPSVLSSVKPGRSKERIRARQWGLIEDRYRWDERRKNAVRRLLS